MPYIFNEPGIGLVLTSPGIKLVSEIWTETLDGERRIEPKISADLNNCRAIHNGTPSPPAQLYTMAHPALLPSYTQWHTQPSCPAIHYDTPSPLPSYTQWHT
ncbi:hypothetical protein RRG08_031998 [Elysia crispata]|uniref:Uncharacterized protein n=1 Tax=Elysia crispata TaxID=231223 RepID=A0AAE1DSZ3_9GAST|nr:hypothetical protein RRG08_031998 [Elysia crispata]